jgi:hypothetical protein
MPAYHFDLIVAGKSEFTDADVDALFESGCDDGTPGSCCGVASVTFTREAESLGDAIGSAVKQVVQGLGIADGQKPTAFSVREFSGALSAQEYALLNKASTMNTDGRLRPFLVIRHSQ